MVRQPNLLRISRSCATSLRTADTLGIVFGELTG